MVTCNICGRDSEHADWCAWVSASLRARDSGHGRTEDWPWWLEPNDAKRILDPGAIAEMYKQRRDLTVQQIAEHFDISEFGLYTSLAKVGVAPDRDELSGVKR
jgi:hypothetical protein